MASTAHQLQRLALDRPNKIGGGNARERVRMGLCVAGGGRPGEIAGGIGPIGLGLASASSSRRSDPASSPRVGRIVEYQGLSLRLVEPVARLASHGRAQGLDRAGECPRRRLIANLTTGTAARAPERAGSASARGRGRGLPPFGRRPPASEVAPGRAGPGENRSDASKTRPFRAAPACSTRRGRFSGFPTNGSGPKAASEAPENGVRGADFAAWGRGRAKPSAARLAAGENLNRVLGHRRRAPSNGREKRSYAGGGFGVKRAR